MLISGTLVSSLFAGRGSPSITFLTLNYFGQGALLLKNPEAIKNPFFWLHRTGADPAADHRRTADGNASQAAPLASSH